MGEVIPFRRRKKKPGEKLRGNTLCREGFHKWVPWDGKQFDVRRGRLVSVFECARCGIRKVETS